MLSIGGGWLLPRFSYFCKMPRPLKIPQLDSLLADVLGKDDDGVDVAKAILIALKQKAIAGDVRAAEILLERAYGKAQQNIGGTIEKKIIFEFDKGDKDQSSLPPQDATILLEQSKEVQRGEVRKEMGEDGDMSISDS